MFDLKSYLESRRQLVEKKLNSVINVNSAGSGRLLDAMKYSLGAGGKRLRPILCIAATEAVGGSYDQCIYTACALEMIHTYSLIHDDLPAMDNDDIRRGKPTCHVKFDEATAILAGDGLLTMAFDIMTSETCSDTDNAALMLKVINIISRAAGQPGMIEGQMTDIESEGKELTFDQLGNMHHLKTGALIKSSVFSGALLGGADTLQINHLKKYADFIGLAFQVADDILNITGDSEVMGKATGTDISLKKATYPSLMGLEQSVEFAESLIAKALKELEIFDDRALPLRAIAKYIVERKR